MATEKLEKKLRELRESGRFDPKWYVETYPDVALTKLDPAEHFLKYGRILKRSGAPVSSPSPSRSSISVDVKETFGLAGISRPFRLAQLYETGPQPVSGASEPKISVVVPNYNNGRHLKQCVNSILSQDNVNVEVIIVDDGSVDTSSLVADSLSELHESVRFISLLRNFGSYYARNIGISYASGEFVAFVDSDDIIDPKRLSAQVQALQQQPAAWGVRCKFRRWSEDFSEAISQQRFGEATLMVRREVFSRIGYFDTVRFGGDSEFRLRLIRFFGKDAIVNIEEELYFARTTAASLTMSSSNGVFTRQDGQLVAAPSETRVRYAENYKAWHKAQSAEMPLKMVSFPLYERPFALGAEDQNASPSLGVRRVATMATFPERYALFMQVLDRILPQVDEIRIYFNEYQELPDLPDDPKIKAILGRDNIGDIKDTGKFFDLPVSDSYIFTIDDDIAYPQDYISNMVHYIEMFQRRCIVGAHGVIFPDKKLGYLENREVVHFKDACRGKFVDLLGTGVLGFHSSLMNLPLETFKSKGLCDLWFAVAAHEQGVPLFAIPHGKDWILPLKNDGRKLYQIAKKDSSGVDTFYHMHLWPLIQDGAQNRRVFEKLLLDQKGIPALAGAGVQLSIPPHQPLAPLMEAGRGFCILSSAPEAKVETDVRFHIVVNGWNCAQFVWPCLASIANQEIGDYSLKVTVVDDGSTDDTLERICTFLQLPNAKVIRVDKNLGPAHARDVAIRTEKDPEAIMTLVDLDDELETHALVTVARRYRDNPDCWMTIGNWHNQHGRRNPQPFYTVEEIDQQKVRDVELFNATALRTFRRKLYDAVTQEDLTGPEGEWLETCTDVAIMYPLLDQCMAKNVEFIDDPIYIYNQRLSKGTLARFGKPHKVERLNLLKSKPRKPRYTGA